MADDEYYRPATEMEIIEEAMRRASWDVSRGPAHLRDGSFAGGRLRHLVEAKKTNQET